jgi:hypothetical protein
MLFRLCVATPITSRALAPRHQPEHPQAHPKSERIPPAVPRHPHTPPSPALTDMTLPQPRPNHSTPPSQEKRCAFALQRDASLGRAARRVDVFARPARSAVRGRLPEGRRSFRGRSRAELPLGLPRRFADPPRPRPSLQLRRDTDHLTGAGTTTPVCLAATTSDPHPPAVRASRAPPQSSDLDLAAWR